MAVLEEQVGPAWAALAAVTALGTAGQGSGCGTGD